MTAPENPPPSEMNDLSINDDISPSIDDAFIDFDCIEDWFQQLDMSVPNSGDFNPNTVEAEALMVERVVTDGSDRMSGKTGPFDDSMPKSDGLDMSVSQIDSIEAPEVIRIAGFEEKLGSVSLVGSPIQDGVIGDAKGEVGVSLVTSKAKSEKQEPSLIGDAGSIGVTLAASEVKVEKSDSSESDESESDGDDSDSDASESESSDDSSSSSSSSSEEEEEEGSTDKQVELEEGEITYFDKELDHMCSDDEEVIKGPIKSKNEIENLPPVPKVDASLEPHHEMLPVGAILSMLDTKVIVEGSEKHNPINEGSILWITKNRSPLGFVDEIFGPVKCPYYIVRYNSEDEIPSEITEGTSISFVKEFAYHVLNDQSLYKKGYDASGDNDEEVFDEAEFSDDEKEAEYRRSLKVKTKRGKDNMKQRNQESNNQKRAQFNGKYRKDSQSQPCPPAGKGWQPHVSFQKQEPPANSYGSGSFSGELAQGSMTPGSSPMTSVVQRPSCPGGPFQQSPTQPNMQWMSGMLPTQQHIGTLGGFPMNGMPYQQYHQNQFPASQPFGMPVNSNAQPSGCLENTLQQSSMQPNMIWANGMVTPPQQQQMGAFGCFPNAMAFQHGVNSNQMLVPGLQWQNMQAPNLIVGPMYQLPMGQGNFGMVASRPTGVGLQGVDALGPNTAVPQAGFLPPMQFNQGSSAVRGRMPNRRGGGGRGRQHTR
ncbi:hypothetical protein QJS04_geneDACA022541 [Acorus gramineus]|uniref:H/ACA ribonucleoprotein complex non-core subunit NAF1 n=1 Tax=Acorus gramineus TaxID=55184 RepID=A0AAV9A894_ACOGR|nr:hypothetical protein QJS04_geneDACA022541 [Acorus gramineus]